MPRGKTARGVTKGRRGAYEALKKQFGSSKAGKASAARIANAGKTKAGRQRMARKAAATRKRRKGR